MSENVRRLCAIIEQRYRTDPDPVEAHRLAMGPSAYQYRNLDEAALVAAERGDPQPKRRASSPQQTDKQREQARERVRRYRERRMGEEQV